jgi:hypothetical protein
MPFSRLNFLNQLIAQTPQFVVYRLSFSFYKKKICGSFVDNDVTNCESKLYEIEKIFDSNMKLSPAGVLKRLSKKRTICPAYPKVKKIL